MDRMPSNGEPIRKLKLAYLTTEYPKGSHTFIRREILEMEGRGHQVLRLAIRGPGSAIADSADRLEAEKTIHFMRLPRFDILAKAAHTVFTRPFKWLAALRMTLRMSRASERGLLRHLAYLAEASVLLRILSNHDIPHVHVHFGTNAAAVARLIRSLGGPTYSMTVHGAEFDSPLGFSLAEKSKDAAFVVAISNFSYAQLCRWVDPSQWHKMHVVRCSVNDDFFEPPVTMDDSCRTILSIGRFSAEKGHLLLLDAMTRVLAREPKARLVLAGDGELRPLIEQHIRSLGLGRHVTLTGWLDENAVKAQIRNARVLVQPSFSEGLPVVIMEALALGRPVIGTMVGGIPELVRADENGWLVTAGSVDELAGALHKALQASPAQLLAMGQAGRARVRVQHHAATEVSRLEALFMAAIPERG